MFNLDFQLGSSLFIVVVVVVELLPLFILLLSLPAMVAVVLPAKFVAEWSDDGEALPADIGPFMFEWEWSERQEERERERERKVDRQERRTQQSMYNWKRICRSRLNRTNVKCQMRKFWSCQSKTSVFFFFFRVLSKE
jgi:hypothetical protein